MHVLAPVCVVATGRLTVFVSLGVPLGGDPEKDLSPFKLLISLDLSKPTTGCL